MHWCYFVLNIGFNGCFVTVLFRPFQLIGEKVGFALGAGLLVVACVGEKLEEREAGHTDAVVTRQLEAIRSLHLLSDFIVCRELSNCIEAIILISQFQVTCLTGAKW